MSKATLILLMVGLLLLFPIAHVAADDNSLIHQKFFGKKAEYQGILRLWNIDSFEGGSNPKSSYLERMAMLFEKKNKGVYFMVENLSQDEVVASIKAGIYPDLVSFGTGMNKFFEGKERVLDDSLAINILQPFYSAGLLEGSLKAVAYMCGIYSLISTSERIEDALCDPNAPLSTLAFALSQDIEKRNETKHIYSLTFGKTEFTDAIEVFSRKFTDASAYSLASSGILDKAYNAQSPYMAYENFILGKSNMLLGTQRDVFRMENRLQIGKEVDAIYEPLGEYTDLVQYFSVLVDEKSKYNTCCDFIKFVLSPAMQKELSRIGMFSVLNKPIYENSPLADLERVIDSKIIVKSTY